MTAPAYLKILQITDMHILRTPRETLVGVNTEHYFHAVLDLAFANQERYDFVLVTGDLAQIPCKESYSRILRILETLNLPCVCLPGNHDDFALMQILLNTEQVNCRRQVLLGNWQFICLNSQIIGSAGGRLEQPELELLDRCLTEYPDRHALIAVHHHCLKTDSVWMDTMTIQNSDAFLDIVKRHSQIRVITTGHIHQLMDTYFGDIRVLGTPSTCFQFRPKSEKFGMDNTPPGYRVLYLYEDGQVESNIARLAEPLSGLQDNTKGY